MIKIFFISIYIIQVLVFFYHSASSVLSLFLLGLSIFLHILFYKVSFLGNLDKPNERSMHKIPTKKSAGIIFIPLFIILSASYEYLLNEKLIQAPFYILLLSLSILGFIDDKKNLSFKAKLIIEFILFGIYFYLNPLNISFIPSYFSTPIYILLSIYFVNIVNFMDGIDSYLVIFSNLVLSIFFFWKTEYLFNLDLAYFFLISIFGFALFNISKARLFMGDAGSLPLGFFLFYSNFLFFKQQITIQNYPFLFIPFLTLSIYIVDSVFTIFIRFKNKENIFQAHKEHLYQKLSTKLNSTTKVVILFGTFQFLVIFVSKFFINQIFIYLSFVYCIQIILYFYLRKKII